MKYWEPLCGKEKLIWSLSEVDNEEKPDYCRNSGWMANERALRRSSSRFLHPRVVEAGGGEETASGVKEVLKKCQTV